MNKYLEKIAGILKGVQQGARKVKGFVKVVRGKNVEQAKRIGSKNVNTHAHKGMKIQKDYVEQRNRITHGAFGPDSTPLNNRLTHASVRDLDKDLKAKNFNHDVERSRIDIADTLRVSKQQRITSKARKQLGAGVGGTAAVGAGGAVLAKGHDKKAASYQVHSPDLDYWDMPGIMNLSGQEAHSVKVNTDRYMDKNLGKRHLLGPAAGALAGGVLGGSLLVNTVTEKPILRSFRPSLAWAGVGAILGGVATLSHVQNKARRSAIRDIVTKDMRADSGDKAMLQALYGKTYTVK